MLGLDRLGQKYSQHSLSHPLSNRKALFDSPIHSIELRFSLHTRTRGRVLFTAREVVFLLSSHSTTSVLQSQDSYNQHNLILKNIDQPLRIPRISVRALSKVCVKGNLFSLRPDRYRSLYFQNWIFVAGVIPWKNGSSSGLVRLGSTYWD